MRTPQNEKRIRVTADCRDAEELKVLCHELLLEARSHEIAGADFDFWRGVYHIARKRVPPVILMEPSTKAFTPKTPSEIGLGFMIWVVSAAIIVRSAVGLLGAIFYS